MATRHIANGLVSAAACVAVTAPTVRADMPQKKPIYDDYEIGRPARRQAEMARYPSLESRFRTAREWLAVHMDQTVQEIDTFVDKVIHVEQSFTSTMKSLAPKNEDEKVLPGTVYTLVATMTGSIAARNRTLPVRALTPLAVALISARYFLPEVSANVGNLAWRYEQRLPQVAEAHLAIRQWVIDARDAVRHQLDLSQRTFNRKVRDSRRLVEDTTGLKVADIESKDRE